MNRFLLTPIALVTCVLAGCSEADQHALAGQDALDECDMHTAHTEFEAAYDGESDNGQYAFAYVLTDLAILVEDPAVQALAPRLGADASFDSEFLWGKGGIVERLSNRSGTCDDVTALIPHPSAKKGGPDLLETIDPALTVGDVRTQLVALAPRLQKLADAAHRAALWVDDKDQDERWVTLEGSCGVGRLDVQAPELFALAAGLQAVVATTQAARAYDGAISVRILFDGGEKQEWVDTMNAHLGHLQSRDGLDDARSQLITVTDYADEVLRAIERVGSPPSAVFDWKAVPSGVVSDVSPFVDAAKRGLSQQGMVQVPTLTPAISVDVRSFFDDPIDLSDVSPTIWSLVEDNSEPDMPFTYVADDTSGLEPKLESRITPSPLGDDLDVESSFDVDRYGDWDTWTGTLDPKGRYSNGYSCD